MTEIINFDFKCKWNLSSEFHEMKFFMHMTKQKRLALVLHKSRGSSRMVLPCKQLLQASWEGVSWICCLGSSGPITHTFIWETDLWQLSPIPALMANCQIWRCWGWRVTDWTAGLWMWRLWWLSGRITVHREGISELSVRTWVTGSLGSDWGLIPQETQHDNSVSCSRSTATEYWDKRSETNIGSFCQL